MKYLILSGLFILSACGGGKGTTPDAIDQVRGCYYSGYGGQTCKVIFDDGQPGYTVTNVLGQNFMCKGPGAL
jgi:hypothetical protein